jgi:hypothetical protein
VTLVIGDVAAVINGIIGDDDARPVAIVRLDRRVPVVVVAGLARYPPSTLRNSITLLRPIALASDQSLAVARILASRLALDGRITSSPTAMRSRTFFELLH